MQLPTTAHIQSAYNLFVIRYEIAFHAYFPLFAHTFAQRQCSAKIVSMVTDIQVRAQPVFFANILFALMLDGSGRSRTEALDMILTQSHLCAADHYRRSRPIIDKLVEMIQCSTPAGRLIKHLEVFVYRDNYKMSVAQMRQLFGRNAFAANADSVAYFRTVRSILDRWICLADDAELLEMEPILRLLN